MAPGEIVDVVDLVASTWEQGDRWGVAFRAASIVPAKASGQPGVKPQAA